MKIKQRNLVAELTSRMLYGRVTSSGIEISTSRGYKLYDAMSAILDAYDEAVYKHPDSTWPKDVVYMTAIMAEEAGEAVQAANDAVHGGASLEPLRKELEQTAAMCIRCLIHLDAKA